jgi:hypothetical protein
VPAHAVDTRTVLEQRLREVDEEIDQIRVLRGELAELLAGLDASVEPATGQWWRERQFLAKLGERR